MKTKKVLALLDRFDEKYQKLREAHEKLHLASAPFVQQAAAAEASVKRGGKSAAVTAPGRKEEKELMKCILRIEKVIDKLEQKASAMANQVR